MNLDLVFSAINLAVLPAWLLLVVLPRAGVTRQLVHSGLYPLVFGAVYAASLVAALGFGQSAPGMDGTSIAGITALFSHPNGVILGWTHFLVFDLFVGSWIGRDALRRGVPHLAAIPCISLSFLLGPVGLLLYVVVRFATGKGGWSLFENDAAPTEPETR